MGREWVPLFGINLNTWAPTLWLPENLRIFISEMRKTLSWVFTAGVIWFYRTLEANSINSYLWFPPERHHWVQGGELITLEISVNPHINHNLSVSQSYYSILHVRNLPFQKRSQVTMMSPLVNHLVSTLKKNGMSHTHSPWHAVLYSAIYIVFRKHEAKTTPLSMLKMYFLCPFSILFPPNLLYPRHDMSAESHNV